MSTAFFAALLIAFTAPFCAAQEQTISEESVRDASLQAVKLILAAQEKYDFKAERDADQKARAAKEAPKGIPGFSPGTEWPYQGVYRVQSGELPPGYRVGGSAICCLGLLRAPGFAKDAARKAAMCASTEFMLRELKDEPLMAEGFLGSYDVRGWGHTYALEWFLRGLEAQVFSDALAQRVLKAAKTLVTTLERTEISETGGWNYSRRAGKGPSAASTFMTAPTLQTLFLAQERGINVDKGVVARALKTLEDARLATGAFQYGTDKAKQNGKGFEDVPGACARMAVCETTLLLAGRGSVDRVRSATAAFFEHWEHLEKRRAQTGTHIPPYMIAPYYFHYAHTYTAQAIEMLPEAERPALRQKLRALYWRTREADGGWNDRVFLRSESFGSAMAILGLMAPSLPAVPRWNSGS
ncbi:MAG: hypothetical protein EXS14_06025 [Planctomycetes bacterium]|nr:hypothetical protein [Planctomycetota bacterium]